MLEMLPFLSRITISATTVGDAGVIQVDESQVTVEGSIFNNNTAASERNGGALPDKLYTISLTLLSLTTKLEAMEE